MSFRGYNIVDSIQYVVYKIQDECFSDESEDGKLQFIVSCLYEENDKGEYGSNKIILTIKHHDSTNSRLLFPTDNYYGFNYLEDIMRDMYNQTM